MERNHKQLHKEQHNKAEADISGPENSLSALSGF